MDDGKILNAEWESGYDQWSIGERIILTIESGRGMMFLWKKADEGRCLPLRSLAARRKKNFENPVWHIAVEREWRGDKGTLFGTYQTPKCCHKSLGGCWGHRITEELSKARS